MTGTGIKAEGAFEEICRMESLAESFKNPSSGDGQSGTYVLPWWKKMISDTITRWKQKSWHGHGSAQKKIRLRGIIISGSGRLKEIMWSCI